jgi:hypothetical protein
MRATVWFLILACAGSACAREQQVSEGSPATAILAVEHVWSDAESRINNRTLDRIFDNALVYKTGTAVRGATQFCIWGS